MGGPRRKVPRRPEPVARLLEQLLERRRLVKPLRIYRIRQQWAQLVGEATAARSWPVSLRQGVLSVNVADSTWHQELVFLKADILARLQDAIGADAVSEIRFFVRQGASSPSEPAPPAPPPAPPERPMAPEVAKALDAFERELDQVADPDLRRAIRRAFVEDLLKES